MLDLAEETGATTTAGAIGAVGEGRSGRRRRARSHSLRSLLAWVALALALALPPLAGDARAQGVAAPSAAATTESAGPSDAPAAPEAPAPPDPGKPMGPPDPFNRGTPRGSMYGFLEAARKGDYETAVEYLDLRRFPSADPEARTELARRLKVVLDQNLWVDVINLSDSNAGLSDDGLPPWQDRFGEIETEDGTVPLLLQRVPREKDGVRIWKVSAHTMSVVPALFARYQPQWVERQLPPFLVERELGGAALWKWLALVVRLVVAALLSVPLAALTIRLAGVLLTRRRARLDDRLVGLVRGPVRLAWLVVLFIARGRALGLPLDVTDVLGYVMRVVLVVAAAWLTFRMIDLAVVVLRARSEEQGTQGLIPVLRPGATFTKAIVVLIGVLAVLGTLGVNVTAAVAGLGVGGIAVALAAQKTLENLFGGITLFADRPVRVGDFFRYGDKVGTVEEIGLRSTRVRTLDRTVVSIPNATFSNLELENFARRDELRLWTLIGVRYETTPDQLCDLLARLRRVLLAHPRVTDDPARVRFVGFGAYSLDLEVFAYVDTTDWGEFLAIREDIYLRFMEAVEEAGTSFAFPSSTTYVGRDEGLDPERIREAEARVAAWREKGELPFPDFPPQLRDEVRNSLPWPPAGSPGSRGE